MLLAPKNRQSHHRPPRVNINTTTNEEDSLQMAGITSATVANASTGDTMSGATAGVSRKDNNNTTATATTTTTTTNQASYVTTTWFLRLCKLLNLVTGLAALLGIFTNISILPIPSPPPDVALRVYGIGFCFLSLLTECEWARLFSWIGLLESWIGRGINNIFCGVLILVFDDTSAVTSGDSEGDAARTWLLRRISGHFLVTMGIIYLVFGLACLHRIKDQHIHKIKKRDEALIQKHELETRKQEIEMLLRDTESQLERI